MAKRPSRTKLSLQDLPPASVRRVFSFINIWLNRHKLSLEYFNKRISQFNPFEQYIICHYSLIYFNNKGSGIYLYRWLEEQYKAFDDIAEPELYERLDSLIAQNQEKLLNFLPYVQKTAERRAKDLKRFEVPFARYSSHYDDQPIDSRIPLVYNKKKFEKVFFETWGELFTKDQVVRMYSNSFQFSVGQHECPKVLYLEVDRKGWICQHMSSTIKRYRELVDRQTERNAELHNRSIENVDGLRKDFTKQYSYAGITRLPFVHMMYNTFPAVRDGYRKKLLKDPGYSRDLYFENLMKNLSEE